MPRSRRGPRHTIRGNIIAARLDQALTEAGWGSLNALLAKLQQMAGEPGYELLSELTQDALSRIRHNDRVAYDHELIAIADALGVSVYWLVGRTDDPTPPPGLRRLL
jgi:hypothetical protein